MKKLLALVLALVLLVTLAACAGAPATPAPAKENTDSPKSDSPKDTSEAAVSSSQEPIYVSVSCAITGDTPQEGEYVRNTVQYVIDQFNADGGVDGRPIELSIKEFELLDYFMENQGIALSREKILNNVWNYDYFGDARTIDTHVKKLRAKIGEKGEYIKTIWGVGYKFIVE